MNRILVEYIKPVIVDSIAWNPGERQLVYPEKAAMMIVDDSAVIVSDQTDSIKQALDDKAFSYEDIEDVIAILRSHRLVK